MKMFEVSDEEMAKFEDFVVNSLTPTLHGLVAEGLNADEQFPPRMRDHAVLAVFISWRLLKT